MGLVRLLMVLLLVVLALPLESLALDLLGLLELEQGLMGQTPCSKMGGVPKVQVQVLELVLLSPHVGCTPIHIHRNWHWEAHNDKEAKSQPSLSAKQVKG